MDAVSWGLICGIAVGIIIGLLLAVVVFAGLLLLRRSGAQIRSSSSRRASAGPVRAIGENSVTLSDSTAGQDSPKVSDANAASSWLDVKNAVSMSGIPRYCYKDLRKATRNFTTVIGEGAYGVVYKATMPTGEVVAVKVLSRKTKEGAKEFQSEVLLLGRLHHRNLVNLVGYCVEKRQHILVYVYMPNGSLASHLYNATHEPLSWDFRISIALDVARGMEYLHDGAVPPIIHRDIKSSNILLDQSMRARVADFGLSREEKVIPHASNIRGTFGYLDPEYISTRKFSKKTDVYSFGVLVFELISGRNPQQGLMEYVELAAINAEGKAGWEELVDSRLNGSYSAEEFDEISTLAYKCVNKSGMKRPSMRDIAEELSSILKGRQGKSNHGQSSLMVNLDGEKPPKLETMHIQISIPDHCENSSGSSTACLPEV